MRNLNNLREAQATKGLLFAVSAGSFMFLTNFPVWYFGYFQIPLDSFLEDWVFYIVLFCFFVLGRCETERGFILASGIILSIIILTFASPPFFGHVIGLAFIEFMCTAVLSLFCLSLETIINDAEKGFKVHVE